MPRRARPYAPFLEDERQIGSREGQRFVVFRAGGQMGDTFERYRNLFRGHVGDADVSSPAQAHVTLAGFAAGAALLPALAEDIVGRAKIIDGDTLDIGGARVRLNGIDAPEKAQLCESGAVAWDCGANATRALTSATQGADVTCRGDKRDRYGRLLAVCYLQGVDLNAQMVRDGWALAYRRYSADIVMGNSTSAAATQVTGGLEDIWYIQAGARIQF